MVINKLLNIFPIVAYPFLNIIVLILLGFGLTYLIIPKFLKSYILWLSPWTTIIVSIFYLVVMSLLGISVKQAFLPLIIIFIIIDAYVLIKLKPVLNFNLKENVLLMIFVGITLILNLSPLIRHDKMLTTISMGNNDIIVYTASADYLKDHSIKESFKIKPDPSVGSILHNGYRWGPPIINSFFLTILNLHAYQYTYISQAVLYSLFVPLVYLLFIILYGKSSIVGLIMVGVFTGFNSNLLYIVYHDFFGQVLFWGIELLFFIFLYSYFTSEKFKRNYRLNRKSTGIFQFISSQFNRYDLILGVLITILYISYHEAAIFLIGPLAIFLIITFFLKRNLCKSYFSALLRIAVISMLTGANIIIHGVLDDYKGIILADQNQPIGWQLFRAKIPFPNPFEAMGLWSIHNFDPMSTLLAIILSTSAILIMIKGVWKSRIKILSISYLLLFLLFFYFTTVYKPNFFTYYRGLTYTLPFIIVIFSLGLARLYEKQKKVWLAIIVILIIFEMWSVVHLNKKFIREHLSIEKSYISLLDLKGKKIKDSIYIEGFMKSDIPLWIQIWTGHFIYSEGISSLPTKFNDNQYENTIPDNSLILISKPTPWFKPLQVILKNTVWENNYYKLARICNKDDCLMKYKENLNYLKIGRNNYEDSLLIRGWSVNEGETRWANEKESTLRLVTKEEPPKILTAEALSIAKPQKISAYIDDNLIGNTVIDTKWKKYNFPIDYSLSSGVHKIKFVYSTGYRPKDIMPGNNDDRTLYINFKEIKLE